MALYGTVPPFWDPRIPIDIGIILGYAWLCTVLRRFLNKAKWVLGQNNDGLVGH